MTLTLQTHESEYKLMSSEELLYLGENHTHLVTEVVLSGNAETGQPRDLG